MPKEGSEASKKGLHRRLRGELHSLGNTFTGEAAALVPQLRVELLENRQAVVDGCQGVLEYSDSCIRLSSARLILRFTGTGLTLRSYSSTSALVEGRITGLEFM